MTETVTITAQDPATASKVITAWTEPDGPTIINPSGASMNGPVLTRTTASLALGVSETFTVTVQVGTHAHGTVLVAADALWATTDPDLLNNSTAVGQICLGWPQHKPGGPAEPVLAPHEPEPPASMR